MSLHHLHRRLARRVTKRAIGVVFRIWLVVSAALALSTAVVNYDLLAAEELGPLARDREVAAGEATALAAVAGEFDAYPRVRYAGLEFALVDARVIPVNRSGHPIVVADLAVRNGGSVQARVPETMIQLIGEGTVTELDRFDYADRNDRLVIEPGATEQALAVFIIRSRATAEAVGATGLDLDAGAVLAHLELQIAEPGRWPASLPLVGPVPEPAFPRDLELVSSTTVNHRGLTVELASARTALEYGVYRASIDRHLAVVTVTVTGSPNSSEMIEEESWSLVGPDGGTTPIRSRTIQRSVDGSELAVDLVFAHDTGSSELDLVVGAWGSEQVVASFLTPSFE